MEQSKEPDEVQGVSKQTKSQFVTIKIPNKNSLFWYAPIVLLIIGILVVQLIGANQFTSIKGVIYWRSIFDSCDYGLTNGTIFDGGQRVLGKANLDKKSTIFSNVENPLSNCSVNYESGILRIKDGPIQIRFDNSNFEGTWIIEEETWKSGIVDLQAN